MIEIFYNNGILNKNKLRESWVEKNTSIYKEIKEFRDKNNLFNIKFSQVLYNFIFDINVLPKCEWCKKSNKRFTGFNIGYNNFCSKSCAQSSSKKIEVENRRKNTFLKYGVLHTSQLSSVKEKQRETNINKYGFKSPTLNGLVYQKQRETMLDRYGVEFSGQSKDLLSKSITTRYESYRKYILSIYKELNIVSIPKEGDIEINCNVCKQNFTIRNELLRLRFFRYKVNPCLICNPISSYKYNSQIEISEHIKNMGVEVINGDRKILDGKEIDIYLPSLRIAIEFNGVYWHSELYKEKRYHLDKKEKCEKLGINMIHIWEDDWAYKKEIVLDRINHIIGINKIKIMARKCEPRKVSDKESKEFLNNNHLQGYIKSSYNIGLYYKNELMALMTFGKLRRGLGYKSSGDSKYELYRFCSKIGISVIGGFSRLLNRFEKEKNPSEIITYANRDWSTLNNVYQNNGFKFHSLTPINYWYSNSSDIRRKHRFQYRKDILLKMGMVGNSEKEIMFNAGFIRTYDCGSIKYVK